MAGIAIAMSLFGCRQTPAAQCEQMFELARQVISTTEATAATPEGRSLKKEAWLQVAELMDTTARELEALPIEEFKLSEYRSDLASVYQIYAEAMADAVRAREVKDIAALKAASDRARYAGRLQQEAVAQINAYCINE